MGLRGRSHSDYPVEIGSHSSAAYNGSAFDAGLHEEASWFAIHTRSRHEKMVTVQLEEKGIRAFLPTLDEVHQWSDRRKVIRQPLFSCYTFVYMAQLGKFRLAVLQTPGVIGFVGINGVGIPIPDQEIDNLKTLIAVDAPYEPYPYLRIGKRVRIVGGSLDGIDGILVAKNTDRSLVVSIELIQRSIAVRLEGYHVNTI